MNDIKDSYPALVLDKMILFPSDKIPLIIENEDMIKIINHALSTDSPLVILFRKEPDKDPVGVLSKIVSQGYIAPNLLGVIVEGLKRVTVENDFVKEGIRMVEVTELVDILPKEDSTELEALSRSAFDQLTKLIQLSGTIPLSIIEETQKEYLSPSRVSNLVSSALRLDLQEKLNLLKEVDVKKRLELLNHKLAKELSIVETEKKIQESLEHDVEQAQKEFFLKERMRAIEKELGTSVEQKGVEDLEKKLLSAKFPDELEKKVLGEFNRLKRMPEMSAEAPYLRAYLEWVSELPWNISDNTKVDIKKAKEIVKYPAAETAGR
ncbi:LON peptidase substrate-binding domain-containing protein [Candidatus Daviesbacteria bacterium]|nr:LON peptidase substrate-binding domain-containing protein [Candidatus Daviesbacteria bacterium]